MVKLSKQKEKEIKSKKVLDKLGSICYYIGALEARTSKAKELQKNFKKKLKKYLTKTRSCDKIAELLRTELKRAESDTVYLVN